MTSDSISRWRGAACLMLRSAGLLAATVSFAATTPGRCNAAEGNSAAESANISRLLNSISPYLDRTRNLRVVTHVRMYLTDIVNMTPTVGARRRLLSESEIEYRKIDRSFWCHLKWWGEGTPSTNPPDLDEIVAYNAVDGIQRGFGANPPLRARGGFNARICSLETEGLFAVNARYGRFFAGSYADPQEFYLSRLLQSQSTYPREVAIERSSRPGEIQVAMQNHINDLPAAKGTIRMWFDPTREYLLTRYEEMFTLKKLVFNHNAIVEKSRLVQGIYLPDKISEVLVFVGGKNKLGTGNVYETALEDAQLDSLTAKDLEVVFPPNTFYVDDQTTGTHWAIDKNGNRVELGHAFDVHQSLPASSWKGWLITLNACVLLIVAGALVRRHFRSRSQRRLGC